MLGAEILLDLVSAMHRIVRPLEDAIENEEAFTNFLAHYGWLVDPSTINIAEVSNSFAILDDLATVGQSLGAIVTAPESDVQLDAYVDLLSSLQKVISIIRDLSSSPVPVGLSSQLWTTFANELLDGLIADYFRIHNPVLFALLVLTGVIEEEQVDVDGVPRRQNYIRWILKWGRITTMVSNPLAFIKESSAWGSVEQPFDYDLLFERLARFFSLIGLQTEFEEPAPELRDIYYAANNPHASKVKELHIVLVRAESGNGDLFKGLLYLLPIPAEDPSDAPGGVVIGPSIELIGDVPAFAISPYSVAFSGAFAHDRSVRIEVRPTGEKVVSESPGETRIDTFIELSDADYPVLLLGSWFSHHLRARGWTTRFHVIGSFQDPEFQFELAFRELGLILDSSDFDVFLKDAFRTDAPSLQFNGSIVWSSKTGLHFGGQAGLELIVPINRTISVVEVNSLALGLRAGDDNLEIITGITGNFRLGPVLVSVDNVGVRLLLTSVGANQPAGVFGDLDLSFDFKPPDGIGIVVDVGPITGGGFLSYDDVAGRY